MSKEPGILIVDDDHRFRETLSDILRIKGYRPITAGTGKTAMEKIEQEIPAIALIDLKLEGISGLKLLDIIKGRCPNTECIVITGHASQASAIEAINLGAYSFVQKPFDIEQLLVFIQRAIEKQEADKALRESEEKYRELINASIDGIVSVDSKMKVIVWNYGAERIFGYNKNEILGKTIMKIVPDRFRKNMEKGFKGYLQNGTGKIIGKTSEFVGLRRDGKEAPVEISISSRKIGDNYISTAIIRDIAERKKLEEELMKSSKLESIGLLAGGIAHDFNNILAAIFGNISLAKMNTDSEDKISEILLEAEKACLRAKSLTHQLLTFSKGGAPVKSIISINELIKDSVNFTLRGSNVRCEFYISEDLWPVEVDEGQIVQVINNLVINADQAMPEGGTIKLRAENITLNEAKPERILTLKEGEYVKISIEDQGIGISGEQLKKIFDPYFTTKQKGSGLGLATAYSIIKSHDGYITAESKLGVGTTFYIYIPVSQKEIPKKKELKEKPLEGKGKILFMDDEKVIRDLYSRLLKHLGYQVEFAKDGAEAIEQYRKAKDSGDLFDAIILDLTIPGGMGGKEAVKKLLEIDPEVKAIATSGYSTDPIMANFKEYGFCGIITKPFKIEELSEILYRVIYEKDEGAKQKE